MAEDLYSPKLVIIKLLLFNEHFHWDDLKLFEREAETLKSLSHKSIPKYIEYFSFDVDNIKGFALVQTYINACSLQDYLRSGRTFSESEVKQLAKSILLVLDYLHSQQPPVIHRDIKPSNILLVNSSAHHVGNVYLVDFGSVQTQLPQDGTITIVGTYGYMAPEQFAGKASFASDLYSLGATLIHLVTGIEPIDLPSHDSQIQFEETVNISPPMRDWLKLMTHPSVKKRFNSVESALKALESGELTIKKPPLSNITLTKTADVIDITIPYRSFSSKKSYIRVINNLKKDYQPSLFGKIFAIISLRDLWSWLTIVTCSSLTFGLIVILPVISLWAFLFFLPEAIRWVIIALIFGGVMIRITAPSSSFDIDSFYQALMPDEKILSNHKDLKYIDALNININEQQITLGFIYTSQYQTKETYTVLKQPRQNINQICFEKKSYKLIETQFEGGKEIEQREVPPSLYLCLGKKRYGLNYKITTPELYWLAEELSYFLNIPISWN